MRHQSLLAAASLSSLESDNQARFEPLPSNWLGELELWFERRDDRTVLARRRHRGPLVVQRPFHPESDGTCHVYLLHPPGGIAGGDELRTEIHIGSGSKILLTTPGATKFYRAAHVGCEQRTSIAVAAGAECEHLPQETILFDGADALIDMRVALSTGARYLGWDFVSFGRPAAGETFKTGCLRQRTEVTVEGELLWIERLQLVGGSPLLQARHGLAGQPILGTMIYVGPTVEDAAERVRRALSGLADGVFSISQLEKVVVCRYLGGRLSQAKTLFAEAWDVLRTSCFGKAARRPRIWAT